MKTVEDDLMRRDLRITEDPLFINLKFRVTEFTLIKVALEYSEIVCTINNLMTDEDLGHYKYSILYAFSLPYRHYLIRV